MRRSIAVLTVLALLCALAVPALAEEAACATADEYVAALKAAAGAKPEGQYVSFDVYVTEEFRAELAADDSLMQRLELEAGLVSVGYGSMGTRIEYKNCVFDTDAPYAQDLDGLIDALNAGPYVLDEPRYVVCSDELNQQLNGDMWLQMGRICGDCCGMIDVVPSKGMLPVIKLTPRRYYSSYLMLEALRTGDVSALTSDEAAALEVARQWASEIAPGDEWSVMRQVHDMVCERTTYDDAQEARHSCVGVLLHGQAVCDGYADAFMLLGSMCGLDVRMQSGTVDVGEEMLYDEGNHAWNMVKIDGEWLMLDTTWDDVDGTIYDYFGLSRAQASADHSWDWGPEGWND